MPQASFLSGVCPHTSTNVPSSLSLLTFCTSSPPALVPSVDVGVQQLTQATCFCFKLISGVTLAHLICSLPPIKDSTPSCSCSFEHPEVSGPSFLCYHYHLLKLLCLPLGSLPENYLHHLLSSPKQTHRKQEPVSSVTHDTHILLTSTSFFTICCLSFPSTH